MTGPTKRYIEHSYFSKSALGSKYKIQNDNSSAGGRVAYTLNIDAVAMSDEQLGRLLEILDRAVEEADSVMGW